MKIRESMNKAPKELQPLLTWLTGRPLKSEHQTFKSRSPLHVLFSTMSLLLVGILGGWFICLNQGWMIFTLPFFWMIAVSGIRSVSMTILHQCSHKMFFGNKKGDRLIYEIFSILFFFPNFKDYHQEHIIEHHTGKLGTFDDPDYKTLYELGFRPGLSQKDLWKNLFFTIISPLAHFKLLAPRFKSWISSGNLQRDFFVWFFILTTTTLVFKFKLMVPYTLSFLVPATILYNISHILNLCSLHLWLKGQDSRLTSSFGRFCGEEFPEKNDSGKGGYILKIMKWAIRMIFIHLPSRLFVVVSDLPTHDYHHRFPKCQNWPDYIYTRESDVKKNQGKYRSIWGLKNAINTVFDSIQKAGPKYE